MDGERYAKAKAARVGEDHVSGLFLDNLVYFNSNDYHGQQFVTQDAVDAGYSNGEVARDATIFERGVGTLLRQDANVLVNDAEEKLLRNIVRFDRARMAMIHSLATSDATGSRNRIDWSQPERAWLFERLVEKSNEIPKEVLVDGRMKDLRFHLANLPGRPDGAFGSEESFDPPGVVETIGDISEFEPPSLKSSKEPEATRRVSDSDADSAIDVSSSIAEMNTPSDVDDIESWAASYDPSLFHDADPVADLEKSSQREVLSPDEVETVSQEGETIGMNGDVSPGCLDAFFASEEDLFAATYDASVSRELRAELEVQEAHAALLRASALKQFAAVKAEWLAAGRVLTARLDDQDAADDAHKVSVMEENTSMPDGVIDLDSMSVDALKEYCSAVATRLRDISEKVHHLDVTAKRIGSRLMDYSNADGIEGRLSIAQQEELASMVNSHLDSLPENWKAPEMVEANGLDRSHNNRDPILGWGDDLSLERVESFEEDMAQISEDWGEWADDDFVWSPENNLGSVKLSSRAASSMPSVLDNSELEAHLDEDEESLENTLHRLDAEWADWESDEVQVSSTDVETHDLDDAGFSDDNADEREGELADSADPDF